MQRPKGLLSTAAGLAVFVVVVLLYNVQFAAVVGDPRIPVLQNKWWGGYFLTSAGDTAWCLARFDDADRRNPRMVLISSVAEPIIFSVQRSLSDETFVYLSMSSSETAFTVSAKQLYEGKRYYTGRLMAGRWRDFWRKNEDIAIRGTMKSPYVEVPFEIEPITDDQVLAFYGTYVSPRSTASIEELTNRVSGEFQHQRP